MKKKWGKKLLSFLAAMLLLISQGAATVYADVTAAEQQQTVVVTLGADLTTDQQNAILQYFGVTADSVTVIMITNADEREQLEGLISDEEIGTHTLSCALVRPTSSGGIQVKTANMNYVTSNMIASTLSTSGVYNCEVLTAAPFEVSGTGALTGVMMAYESANGEALDPEKKELANEELVTTEDVADTVGQDEAILIVNDIKIHIVRDQLTEEQEVYDAVDTVLSITENAAAEAAAAQGKEAPATLGEVEHQKLKDFAYKFSQQSYDYSQMQQTLERVTTNITNSTGIDDPITDTFTTVSEDDNLSSDSVLLGTDDAVLGDDANINSTSNGAVSEKEADPIDVYSGDVTLTGAGSIKATEFISGTNIIAYEDFNGSYALMDLNGIILTDALYTKWFNGKSGNIIAQLDDGTGTEGLLASDGSTLIDFTYADVQVMGTMWAAGVTIAEGGTEEDHDYSSSDGYYLIDAVDLYYLSTDGAKCVKSFTREEYLKLTDYCCDADFINFKDDAGTVTTYDSSFQAVATTDSIYDFGNCSQNSAAKNAIEEKTGYSLSSFHGDYAEYYDSSSAAYGVIDRYGNIIVPAQFQNILQSSADNSFENGGYFSGKQNDQLVYMTAGGTVSASYNYDTVSAYNYGMAARVKKDDGGFVLLSGDGVETDLGTTYSDLRCIYAAKGMLWDGTTSDGKQELLDWHGNVLLSGCEGYSVSANGNYLIAQDGYTSSSIYRINDASEITIGESAGAAAELESTIEEGASLEVYTGDPVVAEAGEPENAVEFIDGTDLLLITEDGEHYAIADVTGNLLTDADYADSYQYAGGWIAVADAAETGIGVISAQNGQLVIPTENDYLDILNKNWIVTYTLTDGTSDDYDFSDYSDGYYQIENAKVYHMSTDEVTYVELTRDQISDIEAAGDYIGVTDRTSGNTIIYDSTFTAVSSSNYAGDFGEYAENYTIGQQLKDSTGYSIYSDFLDGYTIASSYESGVSYEGVIDMNGNLVVPAEYDRVYHSYANKNYVSSNHPAYHYVVNGYFTVKKDDLCGFVKENGEVTCELKYNADCFRSNGMSAICKNEDGTYIIVSGDGQESESYSNCPTAYNDGLFYRVYVDSHYNLVDWHGNIIFEDIDEISFSGSGKYLLLTQDYGAAPVLYTIDGAEVTGVTESSETTAADSAVEETESADSTASDAADQTAAGSNGAEKETDEEAAGKEAAPGEEKVSDLLQQAMDLITSDFESSQDEIMELLTEAETALEDQNPDAAGILGSALSLLDAGSADSTSIQTLVSTVQSMVK